MILEGYNEGMKNQLVSGLAGSAKSLWLSSLFLKSDKTMVVVTHNLLQAQKLYDDLEDLVESESIYLYPVNDLIASEIAISSPELLSGRIDVLNHLVKKEKAIIIIPIAGFKRLLAPSYLWKAGMQSFSIGDVIDLKEVVQHFVSTGYVRETMVTSPGEFSVRGGIIDVYPLTEDQPVRIELFDDEIDSIRYFDSDTQRSQEKINQITIGPAKEMILFPEQIEQLQEELESALSKTLQKVKDKTVKEALSTHIGEEIEALRQGQIFQGISKYIALLYKKQTTILDYLPANSLIVIDEVSRVQETSDQLDREEAEWQTALLQKGEMVRDITLSKNWNIILEEMHQPTLLLSLFLRHHGHIQPQNILNVSCRTMQNFHGQINLLHTECERWQKSNYAVVFLASSKERAIKLENVLKDYHIDAHYIERKSVPQASVNHITIGHLESGFELPAQKLAVITEKEIFNRKVTKKSRRNKKLTNAERLKNYNELNIGDYVVHIDHGIGKYIGIQTLEVNGIHKDYMHIVYKGNDKLYVPVEHIDQVQKYVGSDGKEPKLYALGGTEWKKVKRKAKSSIQDIADDLIKLYAEREASKGYAFSPDGNEQQAFDAAFPYQETDDQLQAIEEIKKDMEKTRPMDRLLCGDVGYGKTEVALRAAFKAIADGKQVAFLVPTTILAQQHFETSLERFEDFPVNIGLLSRFRSRKQQQEVLDGLKKGTVDMVIGTHRLLSKDVVYKDLGLLIVDEEQRFGVTHKEKIKKLKANVDVLTLTATPIPRTLHMSMLGVRDLSVIETPPENRFPVQTYVTEYNGALIKESIERELARGGQVYFLYNRVETIQRMAEQISTLVPDAKVTFAHGQMKETELESTMIDFLEGAYDVLVSTTIIETGVDIPNVNTLIVHHADRMGLSQLYQLRGRVGRSNRVAYAYFTYERDKVINEAAEKRLQAIKEFTELGSGFKIAMRDLSIRGAGNLLGAEQHGFIDSVGFDLYSKMLEDAVNEKRGQVQEKAQDQVILDIESDAYIPDSYIEDSLQKIDMYKRFKDIDSMKDIAELQDEMIDRFGDYPAEVDELFTASKIKVIAERLFVERIKQNKQQLQLTFSEDGSKKIDRVKLFETVAQLGKGIGLGAEGQKIKLTIKTANRASSASLNDFLKPLERIYQSQLEEEKVG
nr:transcription-repair coupling factor [Terrilactibacillus tamarindi]